MNFDGAFEPYTSTYKYTKYIELNKSIFDEQEEIKNANTLTEDKDDDATVYFTPSGKNISVIYKDYNKRAFYSKHEVAYKYFVVKDSLDIFNWTILEDKKELLGYTCQLATMDYRGREYQAWFTLNLPIGGPWKFDGLPGMILELKSTDNFIVFKATRIKNAKIKLDKIQNPFKVKKTLTWEEFKELYKKKAIELLNFKPNENTLGIESSRGGIENYIHPNDMEYNEALRHFEKSKLSINRSRH